MTRVQNIIGSLWPRIRRADRQRRRGRQVTGAEPVAVAREIVRAGCKATYGGSTTEAVDSAHPDDPDAQATQDLSRREEVVRAREIAAQCGPDIVEALGHLVSAHHCEAASLASAGAADDETMDRLHLERYQAIRAALRALDRAFDGQGGFVLARAGEFAARRAQAREAGDV
jgi:hypothetical protein